MSAYLKTKDDIPAVIAEMSTEEKVKFITAQSYTHTFPIERLGIPSITIMDGGTGPNQNHHLHDTAPYLTQKLGKDVPTGIRNFHHMLRHPDQVPEDMKDTINAFLEEAKENWLPEGEWSGVFPPGMLLGATWNPETVRMVGQALAKECDACKMDVILGSPNVDTHRDPRAGRLFEGYSEDPFLVSNLAPELVKGVQEEGLVANVKHYCANNQETERSGINEIISIRALQEIYFPGFRACVEEGGAMTVMSAYNSINGPACALNPWLLKTILKDSWGFDGAVTSDWGAVYDQIDALNAGNDFEQPKPQNLDRVFAAIESGALKMEVIDEAVRRMLNVILCTPAFNGRKNLKYDRDFSRKAAYGAAAEGTVLLKNNSILPLPKDVKIGVFGSKAKELIFCGQGSAEVMSWEVTEVFPELQKILGEGNVVFGSVPSGAKAVIAVVGKNGQEGRDQADMFFPEEDAAELREAIKAGKAAGVPVVAVLNLACPVDLREFYDDLDAILSMFIPGMEGGHAVADILTGNLNPSGKLPLTFPWKIEDVPAFITWPGEAGESWYGEGIFIGYRYYDTKGVEPMFPFGHGLSFSKFEFSDLKFSSDEWKKSDSDVLKIKLKVKNTGKYDGKEVVEVYIHDVKSTLRKPEKELKAFKKVFVKAGETVDVEIPLKYKDLAAYDERLKDWVVEPGVYEARLGTSSREIQLTGSFRLIAHNPYAYSPYGSLQAMLQDNRALDILSKYIPKQTLDTMINRVNMMPAITLGRMWPRFINPTLSGTKEEREVIRDKCYAELASVEVIE